MNEDLDLCDPGDRPTPTMPSIPTLPSAIALEDIPRFDVEAERFFSSAPGPTEDGGLDDELAAWWIEQRRRALAGWVCAVVGACVAVLAAGAWW